MSRQDDLMRAACARLAEEETQALEESLNREAVQQAESLYRQHRLKIFALIRQQQKKKKSYLIPWLRAAACLALVIGAAYLAMHQPADSTPLNPIPTVSIAPYYSPVPSPTADTTTSVISSPSPTIPVTEAILSTISPTHTPLITRMTTPSPTPTPTATPSPTPFPTPDVLPVPQGWEGAFFPISLPQGYQYAKLETNRESRTITYTYGDETFLFTEYLYQLPVSLPEAAAVSYVQLGDQVAIMAEGANGVMLAWDLEDRSLSISCTHADALEIAKNVKKISP